ncbi:hypothetical protein PLESTF_001535200 [Pleodorina starrii]|nr:hypothetical protein PLESTF_001535200 [Pleodorina starrii]
MANDDGSERLAPAGPHNFSVTVTFQNLSFFVKSSGKDPDDRIRKWREREVALLQGVSGWFEPGNMSALMGPSGSGKTTLLDLLAERKTSGRSEGELRYSGIRPSREYLRRYCGYVEQFDTLLPILTVREMLLYTAELKRPVSEPLVAKTRAVDSLLGRLALSRCGGVRIGGPAARGISGGEAKRTNIAIALITHPRVLFLDEPTTGLDSYTAHEVMLTVQAVARGGITVVATLHSPTAFCFSLFDRLMMLVGGRTVYFGPQDRRAVEYFQSCRPFLESDPERLGGPGPNSAEFLVDIITEGDRDGKGPAFADAYESSPLAAENAAELAAHLATFQSAHVPPGPAFADAYESSPLAAENAAELAAHLATFQSAHVPPDLAKELAVKGATVTPWWWAIRTYMKYRTRRHYCDPAFLLPRICDKAVIALLVMTLYWGTGDDLAPHNVLNLAAVLFMWSATQGFVAASYVPSLVLERGLFVRERNDGLYLPTTYLTAKMLDEIIVNAVASLGISAFTFYGIQLQNSFAVFYVSYTVGVCVGISMAYCVASFAPNMDVANVLLPTYAGTLLFFSGFLIRTTVMPPWWIWYSYIVFTRYSWGAVMINQFRNHDVPWIGGETVLQYYELEGASEWTYVGYTSLFFLFFYSVTALVLTFKRYQVR